MSSVTRRSAIRLGAGALASAATLAACGRGPAEDGLSTYEAFTRNSARKDWTLSWQSAPEAGYDSGELKLLSGAIPKDLHGTFYRNGPALFERGGVRHSHWFDGDGMVHAYRIDDGKVSHRGRYVQTQKFRREAKTGQLSGAAFGDKLGAPMAMRGPDDLNVANTSVLAIGGELLALWEGGSAHRLDLQTLETLGKKEWAPQLAGMPFSAHPKREPDGTVWNFGQDVFGKRLIIYKISPAGTLLKVKLITDVPGGMIHDFCITKRHLVFVAPSFRAVHSADTFFGMFEWLPNESQRVIVLDKDDLTVRRDYELPAGFQFHYGNAWEDKSGTIRFAACTGDSDFIEHGARGVMRGEEFDGAPAQLAHFALLPNGRARIEGMADQHRVHEFPQFNQRFSGQHARFLYTVGKDHNNAPAQRAILKHDVVSGMIKMHDYGAKQIAEEHLFVPAGQSEDDGYLIGTTLDLKAGKTRLNILRASDIEDGPVAVLELPYAVPLGFHGAWASKSV